MKPFVCRKPCLRSYKVPITAMLFFLLAAGAGVPPALGGGPSGLIELSAVGTTQAGFTISGESASKSGSIVRMVGDVNNDGFDDLLISAPQTTFGQGAAFLIYGGASLTDLNLASGLASADGIRMKSLLEAGFGRSIGGGGDFNGDGYADFIVGVSGGTPEGRVYTVFGDSTANLQANLNSAPFAGLLDIKVTPGSQPGFSLKGSASGDHAGRAVASVGDFNGDGLDDLLVGVRDATPGGTPGGGELHVVFGKAGAIANDTLLSSFTNPTNPALGGFGFSVNGGSNDLLGTKVASAGDFNGDGFDDLVMGRTPGSGPVHVLFGTDNATTLAAFGSLDFDSSINGSNGFTLAPSFTALVSNGLPVSLGSAGDINGDGFDDLIVGQPSASGLQVATIIYGTDDPAKLAQLNDPAISDPLKFFQNDNSALGFSVVAPTPGLTDFSALAQAVTAAGDVNGDGYDDLLLGAPAIDPGTGAKTGEAYLIFGRSVADGFGGGASPIGVFDMVDHSLSNPATFVAAQGSDYFVLRGEAANGLAGFGVAGAGDVNGDGFDDIAVGASELGATMPGKTYVLFGGNLRGDPVTDDTLSATADGDSIVGGLGNDTLSSLGFAGVTLRGGAGDDTLIINGTERRVDGGGNQDTLKLSGSGRNLDLTAIADNRITGIERIDLRGGAANTLILNVRDLLHLSDSSNRLYVRKDAADTVQRAGDWSDAGTLVENAVSYQKYTAAGTVAELLIEQASGALAGDVNADGDVTLADVIASLQVAAGILPAGGAQATGDADGDGKIGLAEAVLGLQQVSGLR